MWSLPNPQKYGSSTHKWNPIQEVSQSRKKTVRTPCLESCGLLRTSLLQKKNWHFGYGWWLEEIIPQTLHQNFPKYKILSSWCNSRVPSLPGELPAFSKKFRVWFPPGGSMPRHIELRNHSDSTEPCMTRRQRCKCILRCIKPCKSWDRLPIHWCMIYSINSMKSRLENLQISPSHFTALEWNHACHWFDVGQNYHGVSQGSAQHLWYQPKCTCQCAFMPTFKQKKPPPFDVSPTPVLTGSAAWAVALYNWMWRRLTWKSCNFLQNKWTSQTQINIDTNTLEKKQHTLHSTNVFCVVGTGLLAEKHVSNIYCASTLTVGET